MEHHWIGKTAERKREDKSPVVVGVSVGAQQRRAPSASTFESVTCGCGERMRRRVDRRSKNLLAGAGIYGDHVCWRCGEKYRTSDT